MPARRKRDTTPPDSARSFYEEALSEAERVRLPRARELQGLDEEIALLRVRIFKAAQENPQELQVLVRGMSLLVRAVATRYRLSPAAQHDLAESIEGVLAGVGRSLGLEEFSGAAER